MWRPSGGADVRGKFEFWLDPPVLCAMEAHIVPARIVENKGRGCFRPLELTSPRGKKLPNSPLSPLQSSSSPAVIARTKPTPIGFSRNTASWSYVPAVSSKEETASRKVYIDKSKI